MTLVRAYEDLTPLEKLTLINMSYSRIDTFMSCEAKYFYSYIIKERQDFGPAAAMGTAGHAVLENTDLNNLDIDEIIAELENQFTVTDPENKIDDTLRDAAKDALIEFVEKHEGDVFPTVGKELEFNVVIGNGAFKGFIDRVDIDDDDNVLITDYKFGKWEVSKSKAKTNLQLGLYAVVARYLFPHAKTIRAELYYMRSGNQPGHTFSDEDLDAMERTIMKMASVIALTSNYRYTKNTFLCTKMCDYGKKGICPRGATIVRKYS